MKYVLFILEAGGCYRVESPQLSHRSNNSVMMALMAFVDTDWIFTSKSPLLF